MRPFRWARSPGRHGQSRSCSATRRSCTLVPAPILAVLPSRTRTWPVRTLENSSFLRTSVLASWIKAICSAGTPLAMSFCRMSSYTVKAGSGSSSGTASSKAWRVGLSSAFATFLAGRAWGVEMSQNTSWVSLSASPSRQICMMLFTH